MKNSIFARLEIISYIGALVMGLLVYTHIDHNNITLSSAFGIVASLSFFFSGLFFWAVQNNSHRKKEQGPKNNVERVKQDLVHVKYSLEKLQLDPQIKYNIDTGKSNHV
jgi:hypothetical protein